MLWYCCVAAAVLPCRWLCCVCCMCSRLTHLPGYLPAQRAAHQVHSTVQTLKYSNCHLVFTIVWAMTDTKKNDTVIVIPLSSSPYRPVIKGFKRRIGHAPIHFTILDLIFGHGVVHGLVDALSFGSLFSFPSRYTTDPKIRKNTKIQRPKPVSYTHLTLPTICSV